MHWFLNKSTQHQKNVTASVAGLLATVILLAPMAAMAQDIIQLRPNSDVPASNTTNTNTSYYGYGNNATTNTQPAQPQPVAQNWQATSYNNTNASTGYTNTGYSNDANMAANSGYYNSAYNQTFTARVATVPKGTNLMVRLDQPLNSETTRLGDSFSATLENDLFANDAVVVPAGSEVVGQVTAISPAGRLGRHGEMEIKFFGIKTPNGSMVPFRGYVVTNNNSGVFRGDTVAMDIAKGVGTVALGTGAGTVLGLATGSLLGATAAGTLFGLGVGGIAGVGYAMAREGKEVVIPAGSRISVQLEQDLQVSPGQ